MSDYTNKVTRDAWHATGKSWRAYEDGLDILGAVPLRGVTTVRTTTPPPVSPMITTAAPSIAPTPVVRAATVEPQAPAARAAVLAPTSPVVRAAALAPTAPAVRAATMATPAATATSKASAAAKASSRSAKTSAANKAIAAGTRLARHKRGRSGAKLAALGRKGIQKATLIKGYEILGMDAVLAVQSEINWEASLAGLATAADIAANTYALADQLQASNPALANQGYAIGDAAQKIIDDYGGDSLFDAFDASIPQQVSTVQSQAASWQAQAQPATAQGASTATPTVADAGAAGAMPFDPGTSGGGGGAGPSGDAGAFDEGGGDAGGQTAGGAPAPDWDAMPEAGGGGDDWQPEAGAFDDGGGASDQGFADARAQLDSEGAWSDEVPSDEDFANFEDTSAEDRALLEDDEAVQGLGPSDYHFQLQDLFTPHSALQRTMEESDAKAKSELAAAEARRALYAQQSASEVKVFPRADPALVAKLQAAQRKLADAQKRLRDYRAAHPDDEGDTVMGNSPLEPLDDLFLRTYEHEITDMEPDYERRRGSVHRGAAYLEDITYPPGGSSHGQEGGRVMPEQTVEVFGAAYARGLDILGIGPVRSAPPRVGFVKKTTANGRTYTGMVVNRPKHGDAVSSARNALDVGRRAVSVGQKLLRALAKKPTKVHGAGPVRRRAKHSLSHAQLVKLAKQAIDGGNDLLSRASKLDTAIKARTGKEKTGMASVKAKMFSGHGAMAGRTLAATAGAGSRASGAAIPASGGVSPAMMQRASILGAASAALETYLDQINGDVISEATIEIFGQAYTGPIDDSGTPYDPTATPTADPYADPYATGGAPASLGPDLLAPGADANNYGLGPMPTAAPMPSTYTPGSDPASDQTMYHSKSQPLDNIIYYTGDHGQPRDGLGSFNRYYGPGKGAPNGGSGYYWTDTGDGWERRMKPHEEQKDYHDFENVPVDYIQQLPGGPDGSWGPLVGAPNGWTKGLRFDWDTMGWFWFFDQAPSWARTPKDLERLHQAQVDWATAVTNAKTEAAAQAAQEQLEAEEAKQLAKDQAKEDAAISRQQGQEQQQMSHEMDLQSKQDDADARAQALADEAAARQDQSQAQLEDERYARQSEVDRQNYAAQADVEQRAAEMAMRYQAMQPPQQQQGVDDEGLPMDEDMMEPGAESALDEGNLEDVMGLRGSHRLRARRYRRR